MEHQASIDAATQCLDNWMVAFNSRDVEAWDRTFNFPSVRLASNTLAIIEAGYHKPDMFKQGALEDWDHSAWERREVIHAGADKVWIGFEAGPHQKISYNVDFLRNISHYRGSDRRPSEPLQFSKISFLETMP